MNWKNILKARTSPSTTSIDVLIEDFMNDPHSKAPFKKVSRMPKTRNSEWTPKRIKEVSDFIKDSFDEGSRQFHFLGKLKRISAKNQGRLSSQDAIQSDYYVDRL